VKLKAPFLIRRSLFGRILVFCYGLNFNPYAGGIQLNYEENPEWFWWGYSRGR